MPKRGHSEERKEALKELSLAHAALQRDWPSRGLEPSALRSLVSDLIVARNRVRYAMPTDVVRRHTMQYVPGEWRRLELGELTEGRVAYYMPSAHLFNNHEYFPIETGGLLYSVTVLEHLPWSQTCWVGWRSDGCICGTEVAARDLYTLCTEYNTSSHNDETPFNVM